MNQEQVTQNDKPVDSRTSSQKFGDLESGIIALYGTVDQMARDLMTIKEILKVLGNKVNSIVKASSTGEQVTDALVSRIMIENSVEELKNRVASMVAQGVLKTCELVTLNSFVVGRVEDENGVAVNPRLQFALQTSHKDVQDKCLNAKVGDALTILVEKNLIMRVTEVYDIQSDQGNAQEAPPTNTEELPLVPPTDTEVV